MSREADFARTGTAGVTLVVAAVPCVLCFFLWWLGLLLPLEAGMAKTFIIFSLMVVQVFWFVAMAVVFLSKWDLAQKELLFASHGPPSRVRLFALRVGFTFLLLFYVLTGVSSAYSGAGFLVFASIPFFFGFRICYTAAIRRV